MALALVTYDPADQAWTHIADAEQQIQNVGGSFGANFSDIALNGFGFMAYLVPLMILTLGVRFYLNRDKPVRPDYSGHLIIAAGLVMTIVGGCGIENLHFNTVSANNPFLAGGYLGDSVNRALIPGFGLLGCTLAMITLFTTGITVVTGLSWLSLMDRIGERVFLAIDTIRDKREQREDRQIGEKARTTRKKVVSRFNETTRVAPKISPRSAAENVAKSSDRVEREKQINLFDNMQKKSDTLPPLSLLDEPEVQAVGYSDEELHAMSILLVKKLADFNVAVTVMSVHQGPVITRFEIDPAPGVKAATITGLSRDLARAMSTISVRVVENIPGKSYIGIEIPNESREIVQLYEGLSSETFDVVKSPLALVLGKDISGNTVIADLAKMPHLLIAGTTGSGKSVCINALILSILYKASAQHVRMIMVDPKMLELSVYEGIPHLLTPVVTDMSEAANALRWSIWEMERRYKLMSALGVRNLAGYNRKVSKAIESGKPLLDPLAESALGVI